MGCARARRSSATPTASCGTCRGPAALRPPAPAASPPGWNKGSGDRPACVLAANWDGGTQTRSGDSSRTCQAGCLKTHPEAASGSINLDTKYPGILPPFETACQHPTSPVLGLPHKGTGVGGGTGEESPGGRGGGPRASGPGSRSGVTGPEFPRPRFPAQIRARVLLARPQAMMPQHRLIRGPGAGATACRSQRHQSHVPWETATVVGPPLMHYSSAPLGTSHLAGPAGPGLTALSLPPRDPGARRSLSV